MPSGLQAGLASLRWSSNLAAAVFSAAQPGVRAAVNWGAAEFEEELRRDRRRRKRQKVIACCKKVVAFLFSHIGLAGMVVAYSILGGFLFQAIEASYEKELKLAIREFKEETIDEIARLVENYTGAIQIGSSNVSGAEAVSNFTNFTDQLRDLFLEKYRTLKRNGWDLKDFIDDVDLQWSFAGALLFAVTVITTIGYGHIAPKTGWGRLATILYALVGIPLTFLYLSNIGNFLADCFRLFYKKICCDLCCCQECDKKKYREKLKNRRKQQLISARKNLRLGISTDDVPPDVVLNGPTTTNQTDGENVNYTSTVEHETAGPANLNDEEVASQKSLIEMPSIENCAGPCPVSSSRSDRSDCQTEHSQTNQVYRPEKIQKMSDSPDKQKVKKQSDQSSMTKKPVATKNDLLIRQTGSLPSCYNIEDEGSRNLEGQSENRQEYENLQETDILLDETDSVRETDILMDERDRDSVRETDIVTDEDSILETDIICDYYIDQDNNRINFEFVRLEDDIDDDRALLLQFIYAKESDIFEEFCSARKGSHDSCVEVLKQETNDQDVQPAESEQSQQQLQVIELVNLSCGEEKSNEISIEPIQLIDKKENSTPSKKIQKKQKKSLKKTDKVVQADQETSPKTVFTKINSGHNSVDLIVPEKSRRSRSAQNANHGSKKKAKRKRNRTQSEEDAFRDRLVRANTLPVIRRPLRDGKIMVLRHPGTGGRPRPSRNKMPSAHLDLLSPPKQPRKASPSSNCSTFSGVRSTELSSDVSSAGSFSVGEDRPEMTSIKDVTYDAMDTTINLWPDESNKDLAELDGDGNLKNLDEGDDLSIIFLDDAFDYDENLSENEEKITVPVYVCLIIIAGYTLSGSCLFAGWEGWDLMTGSYFCFITLSTIGLGDIVPGSDMTEWEKLVLCALWLVIGLSLLAMCFNLMQEEVKEKCKYIGQKLGLLKDDGRRV